MPLANAYVLPVNRIPDLFRKIQDGQAPERFTTQLLKDAGFKSTNDRAFIPLLKAIGFLTADGKQTQRYLEYRDHSRSKQVMGEALKDAYQDIFLIKEYPTASDKTSVEGKFKSYHNVSDNLAVLMTKTFFGLLSLADLSAKSPNGSGSASSTEETSDDAGAKKPSGGEAVRNVSRPRLALQHTNSPACDERRRSLQCNLQIVEGSSP
jgi:hypothetical protein